MTQIGPRSEWASLLGSQLSTFGPAAKTAGGAASPVGVPRWAAHQPSEAVPGGQGEDLPSAIVRRVAAIDPTDPDRKHKALRALLESAMLAEWGSELLNDPAFHRLVGQVQAQMENRPELKGLMDSAADQLLG